MASPQSYGGQRRYHQTPDVDALDLGPLRLLPGRWEGRGTGWNMIALPFQNAPVAPNGFHFRVLMNQYNEDLEFTAVDDNVPNRGLLRPALDPNDFDQRVVTLDYQQKIDQVAAEDRPHSGEAGAPGLDIHHEPGLFLYMKNLRTRSINVADSVEIDIARLASIPHGNSFAAIGTSQVVEGMPEIPRINGLPIGRFEDLTSGAYDFETDPYLEPYKHYIHNPFKGTVTVSGFPGFSPSDMNAILRFANQGLDIVRTTVLSVDTRRLDAGIVNLPFVVREAEPVSMRSTFWIQEVRDNNQNIRLRMQYSQVVMLNFFRPREDELPGRATWPHISINTLEKVENEHRQDQNQGRGRGRGRRSV